MQSKGHTVLVLIGNYLMQSDPNVICCRKAVQELINRGNRVHIVSVCRQENSPASVDGAQMHYYSLPTEKPTGNKVMFRIKNYLKWFWPFYKYPFSINKEFVLAIRNAAEEVLGRFDIDAVICVHFPPESLVAAHGLIEHFPKTKFVSYMLDESSGGFCPRFLPERFCRRRKIRWEDNLLRPFHLNILMETSLAHHEKYSKQSDWYKKAKYLNVPLFGDKPDEDVKVSDRQTFQVAFCGNLNYPLRNVPFMLDLIARQNDMNIQYLFAGPSNCKRLLDKQYPQNVSYIGEVAHSKVKEILKQADVFLNLGVKEPGTISGKIFEYMSYGKPIICTHSIDNEACIPYIQAYPLGMMLDERNENMDFLVRKMNAFIYEYGKKRVPYEAVKQRFYNSTPEAFADFIETALG